MRRRPKSTAKEERRRPGRPSQATSPALTRKRILRAALKLVDRQGVEALSIRKLAAHLGVTPKALYSYVHSREDLLQGVVHLLFGNLTAPDSGAGHWSERFRELCRWYRARLLEHPNMVETASFGSMFPFAFAPLSAALGGCLLQSGFEGDQVVRIVLTAQYHTIGFVTLEVARARHGFVTLGVGPGQSTGPPGITDDLKQGPLAQIVRGFDRATVSDYLARVRDQDMDALFEYSLDRLLAGLVVEKPGHAIPAATKRAVRKPHRRTARRVKKKC